jgi:hypothetical protein
LNPEWRISSSGKAQLAFLVASTLSPTAEKASAAIDAYAPEQRDASPAATVPSERRSVSEPMLTVCHYVAD